MINSQYLHKRRIGRTLTAFLASCLISALGACTAAPSEKEVTAAIIHYFEVGHYRVSDLKIGKIESMPLSEKTYMGTPGYVVRVVSITLDPQTDRGADIKKGKAITFVNALILVRQDAANKNIWHVSVISGISVP